MNDGGARNARSAVITLRVSSDASIGYKGCKGAAQVLGTELFDGKYCAKSGVLQIFYACKAFNCLIKPLKVCKIDVQFKK